MNFPEELKIQNKVYKKFLKQFVELNLEQSDITSKAVVKNEVVKAEIIAKQDGILAGREEAEFIYPKLKFKSKDGTAIKKGQIIATITDKSHKILQYERLVLNLIMRMSGIATNVSELSKKSRVKLAATRKTYWGLIDKKAVSLGGGLTHRLQLSHAILIKENHIQNQNISLILKKAEKMRKKAAFIEIEVETQEQAIEASKWQKPLTIMLDNFRPKKIKETLTKISKTDRKRHKFEASGGINEKNLKSYSSTGIDIISMSALTDGVKSLDMSLLIKK